MFLAGYAGAAEAAAEGAPGAEQEAEAAGPKNGTGLLAAALQRASLAAASGDIPAEELAATAPDAEVR